MYDLKNLKNVGEDVWINKNVSIRRPELVDIGSHVSIDEYFVSTTAMQLGSYIHISPHVTVTGGKNGLFTMGDFSNLSVGCRIICVSDKFKGEGIVFVPGVPPEMLDETISEPVVMEDFVNTGTNVTILPGVTIPEGAVIGACSLVKKSDKLKPWTIYAGNPLKEICPRKKETILNNSAKLKNPHS